MRSWTTFRPLGMWVAACLISGAALAQQQTPSDATFVVTPVAEKVVSTLPSQPLYWVVERFVSRQRAARGAAPNALIVEARDAAAWRFTLSPGKVQKSAGTMVRQIGPVPVPEASKYLLRINHAGGPPGAKTAVHTHSGSEAFLVLTGSLCQRTEHGTVRLDQGGSMNGHAPGMVMQLTSCGEGILDQYVMFVVDAEKPFSTPAEFN